MSGAWSELAKIRKEVGIEKTPWVQAAIEEVLEAGEKIIVFCHHNAVADILAKAFRGRCVVVNGRVSAGRKNAACEKFQDPDSSKALLVSVPERN